MQPLGDCSEGKGEARIYRSFLQQRPGRNFRRFLLVKENQISQVTEVSAFFYVWEDTKVRAH